MDYMDPLPKNMGDRIKLILSVLEDGDTVGMLSNKLNCQAEPLRAALNVAHRKRLVRRERDEEDSRKVVHWFKVENGSDKTME